MQRKTVPDPNNTYNEWIFYDGQCRTCLRFVRWFRMILNRRHIGLVPHQDPWARNQIPGGCDPAQEMLLKTREGKILGGADALIYLARRIRWAYGLYLMARVPGIRNLMRRMYRHAAAHRHCGKRKEQ